MPCACIEVTFLLSFAVLRTEATALPPLTAGSSAESSPSSASRSRNGSLLSVSTSNSSEETTMKGDQPRRPQQQPQRGPPPPIPRRQQQQQQQEGEDDQSPPTPPPPPPSAPSPPSSTPPPPPQMRGAEALLEGTISAAATEISEEDLPEDLNPCCRERERKKLALQAERDAYRAALRGANEELQTKNQVSWLFL